MTFFAFADRRGVIEFGNHIPAGTLHIADDPDQRQLCEVIESLARHTYDGKTLLVPGIPEAETDNDALDALIAFRQRVARSPLSGDAVMTDLSLNIPHRIPFATEGGALQHYREVGARLGKQVRTPIVRRPGNGRPAAAPAVAEAAPVETLHPARSLPLLVIGPANIRAVRALAHFAAGELDGPLYIQGPSGTGKSLLAAVARVMCPDAIVLDDAEEACATPAQQLQPKRMVLTSSVPPAELNNPTLRRACREAALVSLEGFTPVEARAVAVSMLETHRRHFPAFALPVGVLDRIAADCGDGHIIAACIKGLLMHHWAGEAITAEMVGEVLSACEAVRQRPNLSIAAIQRVVANHFGVSVVDIQSQRRTAAVVLPRQMAMYLAKMLTLRSLPEIGRRFGGRDHTTVLHAVRKITALESSDMATRRLLAMLSDRLQQTAGERA